MASTRFSRSVALEAHAAVAGLAETAGEVLTFTRVLAVAAALGLLVPSTALAAAPVVSSFAPASGIVGTAVTLSGSGFTGANAVKFNGTGATYSVTNDTTIATSVPNGATTGKISVTTGGGTGTSSTSFKVKPQLTSFAPTSGSSGPA